MILHNSRKEAVAKTEALAAPNRDDDPSIYLARTLARAADDLLRVARYIRAAEVRQVIAISAVRAVKPN